MVVTLYGAQVNLSNLSTCLRVISSGIYWGNEFSPSELRYSLIIKHWFSLDNTHGKLIYDNRYYRRTYPRSDLRSVFVFYNSHISSFPLNPLN